MKIQHHLDLYISLRETGRPATEAVAVTQMALGSLSDLDYSQLILAIAAYEINTAGTRAPSETLYSNRTRASSALISSRTF